MNASSERFRDLDALLAAVCDQTAGPEDIRRIELLAEDDEGIGRVLDYLRLDGLLRWENGSGIDAAGDNFDGGMESEPSTARSGVLSPPVIVQLPDPVPAAAFNLQSPFAVGMVSYAAALLIMCAALLGAWAYKINHYQSFVQNDQPPVIEHDVQIVGQISRSKDCVCAADQPQPYVGSATVLGRKYTLLSGLLEITYATGARVILEGPCEYTADSRDGGFLRVGKLVARVEKSGERRGERGEKADGLVASATSAKPQAANPEPRTPNPESPVPSPQPPLSTLHSPLFTVSTPTAVVTDLGTEFGVEVKPNMRTEVHVFQGKIEAKWRLRSGDADKTAVLTKGQAAEFDPDLSEIVLSPTRPGDFVRAVPRPPAKPADVAAKKTIVKWSGVYRYGDSSKGTSDWTTLERFGPHRVNDGITDETDAGKAYWLGREQTPDEYFVIFLRGRYLVGRIELMNTHNGPGNDRGTKDFEIWAADEVDTENDLVSPRLVLKGRLPCRFGAGADIPYDVFTAEKGDFERFNARYVKFVAKTYYENKGFGGCGLNEIRLFATSAGAGNE